jgi:hypothetical protein
VVYREPTEGDYGAAMARFDDIGRKFCLQGQALKHVEWRTTVRIGALTADIGPPLACRKGGVVRDSIADSESFRSASQGGRLQSEWVDFRRNRWPTSAGLRSLKQANGGHACLRRNTA